MSEEPILFCGEMVRAILEGRKTLTRRLVKPQPIFTAASGDSWEWNGGRRLMAAGYGAPYVHSNTTAVREAMLKVSPWQVGDRLWVKETWCDLGPCHWEQFGKYGYRADKLWGGACLKWHPSLLMPRIAARLFLTVTCVRVERLQEISVADCIAEGIDRVGKLVPDRGGFHHGEIVDYSLLWDSLNAQRGFSWDSNPWVWVITFKPVSS